MTTSTITITPRSRSRSRPRTHGDQRPRRRDPRHGTPTTTPTATTPRSAACSSGRPRRRRARAGRARSSPRVAEAESDAARRAPRPHRLSRGRAPTTRSPTSSAPPRPSSGWRPPRSARAPPVLGTGQVRTAHGLVPVPAPATAELLADVPVRAEGQGELTTPTGAAILAAVVDRFGAAAAAAAAGPGLRRRAPRELADRAERAAGRCWASRWAQPLPDSADRGDAAGDQHRRHEPAAASSRC